MYGVIKSLHFVRSAYNGGLPLINKNLKLSINSNLKIDKSMFPKNAYRHFSFAFNKNLLLKTAQNKLIKDIPLHNIVIAPHEIIVNIGSKSHKCTFDAPVSDKFSRKEAESINLALIEWAEETGIINMVSKFKKKPIDIVKSGFKLQNFGLLTCLSYPYVSFESKLNIAKILFPFFMHDDLIDTKGSPFWSNPDLVTELNTRLYEILKGIELTKSSNPIIDKFKPIEHAFREVRITLKQFDKKDQYLFKAIRNYFQSSVLTAKSRKIEEDKSLSASIYIKERPLSQILLNFMDQREYTGAVGIQVEIGFLFGECEPEEEIRENIYYNLIFKKVSHCSNLSNDVISYSNDEIDNIRNNLVCILENLFREKLIPEDILQDEAIKSVSGFHNTEMKFFKDNCQDLYDSFPEEHKIINEVVLVMKCAVSSILGWSIESGRYSGIIVKRD